MDKKLTSAIFATVFALTLTACGGESDSVTTTAEEGQALVEVVEEAVQASGGFDSPVVTPDKVSYTLSSPTKFTPGQFASGMLPNQVNQRFNLSISNGSAADLDLATLIVKGSTTTGDCADIFDGDNQMEGAPTTPLASGATAKFSWGLACNGKSGDDLSVLLTNGVDSLIEVTGKIA